MISKTFSKFIIKDNKTIKNAIYKINKYGKKILFVVDKKDLTVGSLSDGDIRKALLKGFLLSDKISIAMNKKFFFLKDKKYLNKHVDKLKKNNIIHVPVCVNKKIKDIIDLSSSIDTQKFDIPFVILAGGKGQRMMPLTKNLPKPLLKVNNKPVLEHIIINAKKQGFENFIISVGYLGSKIKKYFQNGLKLGVNIKYITEKKALGTAGALGFLRLNESKFVVTNGDILTGINYKNLISFHNENNSFATMAIRRKLNNETFGVVETNGRKFLSVKEKPIITYSINTGIYILNSKILKFVKKNQKIEMTDLFNNVKKKYKKKLLVFPVYENWLDLANSKDLYDANKYFDKFN